MMASPNMEPCNAYDNDNNAYDNDDDDVVAGVSSTQDSRNAVTSNLNGGGIKTASIMWITPFVERTSGRMTVAESLSTIILPSDVVSSIVLFVTYNVGCIILSGSKVKAVKSVDNISPSTTWYIKMADNAPLFSSFDKHLTNPSGRASNASSVGANTVYGPLSSPDKDQPNEKHLIMHSMY
jgi:hypothetical protein